MKIIVRRSSNHLQSTSCPLSSSHCHFKTIQPFHFFIINHKSWMNSCNRDLTLMQQSNEREDWALCSSEEDNSELKMSRLLCCWTFSNNILCQRIKFRCFKTKWTDTIFYKRTLLNADLFVWLEKLASCCFICTVSLTVSHSSTFTLLCLNYWYEDFMSLFIIILCVIWSMFWRGRVHTPMILQNGIAVNCLHCADLFGLAKPNIVDRLMSVLAYWMLAHQARDLDYKCVCVCVIF